MGCKSVKWVFDPIRGHGCRAEVVIESRKIDEEVVQGNEHDHNAIVGITVTVEGQQRHFGNVSDMFRAFPEFADEMVADLVMNADSKWASFWNFTND